MIRKLSEASVKKLIKEGWEVRLPGDETPGGRVPKSCIGLVKDSEVLIVKARKSILEYVMKHFWVKAEKIVEELPERKLLHFKCPICGEESVWELVPSKTWPPDFYPLIGCRHLTGGWDWSEKFGYIVEFQGGAASPSPNLPWGAGGSQQGKEAEEA